MRLIHFGLVTLAITSCVSQSESTRRDIDRQYVVKYYDRNHDGIVDLEFHDIPGAMDAAWALVDTTFSGRYDLEIHWGIGVTRKRVSIPVPRNVSITRGRPPVRPSDLHFRRSNQAMNSIAPRRCDLRMFATAPCSELSLSR
jgi:hypothetical protein